MSEQLSIIEIEPEWRRELEPLGSKPKFWFRYDEEDWLFKVARENTGEHWAEKLASDIALALGLPTHRAELAVYEGRRGSAVRSFLKKSEVLIHGNEVLGGTIVGYEKDKQHGQADHNFDNIVAVLERLFKDERNREIASLRFVGYLVLDALVGNTDRHHENWGILLKLLKQGTREGDKAVTIEVAPTFDHASSLGRELLDERRLALMAETGGIGRYLRKARGGIFANADARRGLAPINLVEMIANRYPKLFQPWQERLSRFETEDFSVLVAQIPEDWMGEVAKEFVLAFLEESRKLLLCIT